MLGGWLAITAFFLWDLGLSRAAASLCVCFFLFSSRYLLKKTEHVFSFHK